MPNSMIIKSLKASWL